MRKSIILIFSILCFLAVPLTPGIDENITFSKDLEITQLPQPNRQGSPEELLKLADEIVGKVSAMRGLKFKSSVKKKVTNQNEVRAILMKELSDPETTAKIYGEGKMFKKLGLIPDNFDYGKFMVDLYVDQLAGFYVPEDKTMYIAGWIPIDSQGPILAHELTHALQDQYFDLAKILKANRENSDLTMAKTSVVEGEATFIMMEYMMKDYGMSLSDLPNFSMVQFKDLIPATTESKLLATAPPIITETMNFPYLYGTDFFMACVRKNGWKKVSDIYSDLPTSSQQIMHPEKYLSVPKNEPVKIDINVAEATLGNGWKKIDTDVLGEFFLNVMIGQFATRSTASIASEGWRGDEIKVYENNSSVLLLFESAWDTSKDAKEFFEAYNQIVEKKYINKSIIARKDNYNLWNTTNQCVYVGINNDRVFIIEGASEDLTKTLINSWK